MTCKVKTEQCLSKHPHFDWMFYSLYHDDLGFLRGIINSSIQNIETAYSPQGGKELNDALQWFANTERDSVNMLRAKLFLLLDVDEATRLEFTVFRSSTCKLRDPLPHEKANRFYPELHERVIPTWLVDETKPLQLLIEDIRNVYLVS